MRFSDLRDSFQLPRCVRQCQWRIARAEGSELFDGIGQIKGEFFQWHPGINLQGWLFVDYITEHTLDGFAQSPLRNARQVLLFQHMPAAIG